MKKNLLGNIKEVKDLSNIESIKELAKTVLEHHGNHQPQFLLFKGKEAQAITAPWKSDMEKKLLMQIVRNKIQTEKTDFYYFIQESWMLKQPKEKGFPKVMPRDSPDRIEALIVSRFDKELTEQTYIIEFRRDKDNKITFGEETQMTNKNGTINNLNLYLEDASEENEKAMRRMMNENV